MASDESGAELIKPLLYCPACRKLTDSLKSYHLPIFLFLFVFCAWSSEQLTACPKCMPKRLSHRILAYFFLSNLAWPFFAAWYGFLYFDTYRSGPDVPADQFELYLEPPPFTPPNFQPKPSFFRVLIVLCVLAAALGLVLLFGAER